MQVDYRKYKEILTQKAEELRQRVSARSVSQAVSREACPADEGDLSQRSHEEWLFINRNTLESNLLRELVLALRRLEEEEYGVCLSCEQPISSKRLDALPWASYCVVCQERRADSEARQPLGRQESLR
jgi:DnaK suppressor protein